MEFSHNCPVCEFSSSLPQCPHCGYDFTLDYYLHDSFFYCVSEDNFGLKNHTEEVTARYKKRKEEAEQKRKLAEMQERVKQLEAEIEKTKQRELEEKERAQKERSEKQRLEKDLADKVAALAAAKKKQEDSTFSAQTKAAASSGTAAKILHEGSNPATQTKAAASAGAAAKTLHDDSKTTAQKAATAQKTASAPKATAASKTTPPTSSMNQTPFVIKRSVSGYENGFQTNIYGYPSVGNQLMINVPAFTAIDTPICPAGDNASRPVILKIGKGFVFFCWFLIVYAIDCLFVKTDSAMLAGWSNEGYFALVLLILSVFYLAKRRSKINNYKQKAKGRTLFENKTVLKKASDCVGFLVLGLFILSICFFVELWSEPGSSTYFQIGGGICLLIGSLRMKRPALTYAGYLPGIVMLLGFLLMKLNTFADPLYFLASAAVSFLIFLIRY